MPKYNPILLSVSLLLAVSLACTSSAVVITPDPNQMGTAIAQTLSVVLTQTAPPLLPTLGPATPTSTFTPELPTFTPTVTLTPSVTVTPTPLFTSTPLVPLISVSVPTNCRVGPGRIYDRVGALLVGEVAEVVGRDSTGNYWYIRNPDASSGGFCWLWGEYATLGGNLSALPIFTPPPTPTPAPGFDASYRSLDTCAGWWVHIRLENTGGVTFRSVALTVRDLDTDTIVALNRDDFTNIDGCVDSDTEDSLLPGDTLTISSPPFAYDPSDHRLRATITLCSNTGQNGTCVTEVITFRP
jgi:hypothetical protein